MPTSKRLNVAVVGATGMVGQAILSILAERHFPSAHVKALASERSTGMKLQYNGSSIIIEPIDEKAFNGVDVALFAAAGVSVAVANAVEVLKERADVVLTQPNGKGVADLIEALLAGDLGALTALSPLAG